MQIFIGFFYYLRGFFYLLTHPQLWIYVVYPGILSFVSFQVICFLSDRNLKNVFDSIDQSFAEHDALRWLIGEPLHWLIYFLILTIAYVCFLMINLLSSPGQNALSSKTEELVTGVTKKFTSSSSLFKRILSTIFFWIKRIFLGLLVFIISPIPIVGQIVMIYWTARQAGWNYLNVSMNRHKLSASEKENMVSHSHWMMVGFGIACMTVVMLAIPLHGWIASVIGVLMVPCSVVSGTLLHIEKVLPTAESAQLANKKK